MFQKFSVTFKNIRIFNILIFRYFDLGISNPYLTPRR